MAATEDSNKFIIYKGNDDDYAFIPLNFSYDTFYDFTNGIIANDGNTYIKNLNNNTLTESVKKYIIDNSAIRLDETISILSLDNGYKIKDYINNNMLLFDINLYYIENFKYRLDVSQYYVDDNETGNNYARNAYMFTITPDELKYNIDDINIDDSASLPPDSGGDSGGGSTGETEDKKYDIIFSIPNEQLLSLQRVGTTNDYKLTGTLSINYRLSDDSIKGDEGTAVTSNLSMPILTIKINNISKSIKLKERILGYMVKDLLWQGNILLLIDEYNLIYNLTPGTDYENNTLLIPLSKSTPIFTRIGNKLNNYIGNGQLMVNLNNYTFKLLNLTTSNKIISNVYFLQSQLSYYTTWNAAVSAVMNSTNTTTRKVSGIFIIITDPTTILPSLSVISSVTSVSQPSFNSTYFKYSQTNHNSIFTSLTSSNAEVDGPPIFLYDENNKQTIIISYERDTNIFNTSHFIYKSGNKFDVSDTSNKSKNIINLNNYRNIMYEYSSTKLNHYCGTNIGSNTNLNNYEGKTFNVVFEVWLSHKELIKNDNDLIINNNNDLLLKAISPILLPIDKIDDTTITTPIQSNWIRQVTMYKLYSFKLSKTDSSTGVYEYTYTD